VNDQLSRTKAACAAALEEHGFDLVVIVTVVKEETGLRFHCVVDGVAPPAATPKIASALREVAENVEAAMNRQTVAWQSRGVS